jgi:hypothetical protein
MPAQRLAGSDLWFREVQSLAQSVVGLFAQAQRQPGIAQGPGHVDAITGL